MPGYAMAARFVLDKVVCETISPLSGLARTRSFVHSSQHPAEVLPRYRRRRALVFNVRGRVV